MNLSCNHHVATFNVSNPNRGCDKVYRIPLTPLNLPTGVYVFTYDYPLNNKAVFEHVLNKSTTAADLLQFGKEDYQKIYAEEDKTTNREPGNIPGMLNRNTTDGKYGIWGHSLDDLYFEQISIDDEKKTVYFAIGS